jgi:hypothetical protein
MVELHLHCPIHIQSVVLSYVHTDTDSLSSVICLGRRSGANGRPQGVQICPALTVIVRAWPTASLGTLLCRYLSRVA